MRKIFQQQNLSENVTNLLNKSWTPSTCKQYSPHIICWLEISSGRKIDPFNASVNDEAEFLAKLFNESKCEYSVTNTARSAFSSIFPTTNGISFGKQLLIQRLLKGIFKERPSLPRYTVTFDVKPVFKCIKEISCSDNTSLEICTKVLAAIMSLISGQRSQALSLLQTNSMYVGDSRVTFYISKLTKTSRPNFHQKLLEFLAYPSEKTICVVRIIKLYLDKKANLRDKNIYSFFISYVAPCASVTPKPFTGWVVETRGKAGINTKST